MSCSGQRPSPGNINAVADSDMSSYEKESQYNIDGRTVCANLRGEIMIRRQRALDTVCLQYI
jgi:hypothetical protein